MSSLRFVLVEYVSQLFHMFDASKNQALPILFKLPAIPSDSFHVRLSFLLTYQEKNTFQYLDYFSFFPHQKTSRGPQPDPVPQTRRSFHGRWWPKAPPKPCDRSVACGPAACVCWSDGDVAWGIYNGVILW